MKSVNNFAQGMPDGPEQNNIPMLLERVANSIAAMKGVQVLDLSLRNSRVEREKPMLDVYYEADDKGQASEYQPELLIVKLPKGKNQNNFSMLLGEVIKEIEKINPREIFNVTMDNDINELGDHYQLAVYYDPRA